MKHPNANLAHPDLIRHRQIAADPNGNRAQRRAAKKLGVTAPTKPAEESPEATDA